MVRRDVVQATAAGVGGLALARLLGCAATAQAAPSDPGAGQVVTPDPIPARILPSGIAVELVEFCTPPPTQATYPRAMLNFMYHAGDGSGRLFVNDSRGKLWAIDRITGAAKLFLDVAAARGAAFLSAGHTRLACAASRSTPILRVPASPAIGASTPSPPKR